MYKLSYSTFGVARLFMAIAVFFCHVFKDFNNFGFLFVGVFFFMSGYGMEYSRRRDGALLRLIPYILFFLVLSVVYWAFFRVFIYPSSWFLVVYFVLMVLYRFIRNIYGLVAAFCALAVFFGAFGFEFGWCASYGAFLWGVLFAMNPCLFTLKNVFLFLPGVLLLYIGCEGALWCVLPLFSWVVLSLCSMKVFLPLAFLGRYTFYFYCVHCFFLGLFGVTWTLGGSPEFWGVFLAFVLSVFFALFFEDYLFNYKKVG